MCAESRWPSGALCGSDGRTASAKRPSRHILRSPAHRQGLHIRSLRRGIIQRVEPIEDTDVSDIVVKVTKTLRRWPSTWDTNEIEEASPGKEIVQVGRHCGAQHGAGEIVIMARRKLGQLVLRCAPRLQEWQDVIKEAIAKDSAHCVL
ncbi:unnamed protein product, partial [Nesidiocoris tenuis]